MLPCAKDKELGTRHPSMQIYLLTDYVTINFQLSSDTGISFYACDITGNLLGSVQYQNREAGEWQDCIVLFRRPIGGTLMLRIDCGNERFSLKVFQSNE